MSKYCPNCGTQLPDAALFCPKCGNAAGQQQPPYAQASNDRQTQEDLRMVTPNIALGPDGKYRWIYEMSLFKNPSMFMTVWKVFFFIALGGFIIAAIVTASNGDMDGKMALNMLMYFGIALIGITVLVGISFLIYAAIMGGKYIVLFEMDDNGINHKQIPSQAKKAKGLAAGVFVLGMLTNNRAAMTGGIAASNTEMYTSFSKTRKIRFYPRRGSIKIRHLLFRNQIYAKPEDFAFVQDYILLRVPDKAKPKK